MTKVQSIYRYPFSVYLMLSLFMLSLSSCEEYEERALIVAGDYSAHVVNGYYDFDLRITLDGDDNVLIEALFDDYTFEIVRADLDDRSNGTIDFDIHSQNVYGAYQMWGDGIYDHGYLQLDYKIDWGPETIKYRISGTQY